MSCSHNGTIYWDSNTEEWYCRRCGEAFEEAPTGWTQEDIADAKGENNV